MRPELDQHGVVKIGALRLTGRRLDWLKHLRDQGIARRWRSKVGFECMQSGLTTWAWRDPDTGEILEISAKRARFEGNGPWPVPDGEMLTELGREALILDQLVTELGGRALDEAAQLEERMAAEIDDRALAQAESQEETPRWTNPSAT